MPGDLVFGDREGVNFIPPQAVERLIEAAKTTHIHDELLRNTGGVRRARLTN